MEKLFWFSFGVVLVIFLLAGCDKTPLSTEVAEGTQLAANNSGNNPAWKVPGDFATLQEAIDSAQDGDRILVGPGQFAGAEVTKAVEIKGVGGAVITSGPKPWPTVPGRSGYMAGFLFPGNGAGSGARIVGLRFESLEFPVFSRLANQVTIEQCTFIDAIQAISNWRGSDWVIVRNEISGLRTANGGGIGVLIGDYRGGTVNGNAVSHNRIRGTLQVASTDGGGYAGSGIVIYADFRWGAAGAAQMSGNRIVQNNVALSSDNPSVVDVVAVELTEAVTPELITHVIYDNAIGFNDLRGTVFQLALSPESLEALNPISRNLGENRAAGLHPSVFDPGLGKGRLE